MRIERRPEADPLLGGERIDHRRFTGYGHVVGDGSDLQGVCSPHILCGAQWNCAAFVTPEPGQADLERIHTDGNKVEPEFSGLAGQLLQHGSSAFVDQLYFRSR